MLINVHEPPKVPAEGHGCPAEGEGHLQGYCLLNNSMLIKNWHSVKLQSDTQ